MARDFTLEKYKELLRCAVENGYTVCTVADHLTRPESTDRKYLVLRHDVDRIPSRALQMARLEHQEGMCSTYYFRATGRVFNRGIMSEIASMGHEIGYHYEVMDRAKGDLEGAKRLFSTELAMFREIADVKTCAMHGNPLTKWDNRDIWKHCSWERFGLVGEAYLSFRKVVYLSDTGRTWSPKHKVKDWMPSADGGKMAQPDVSSTEDLMAWLSSDSADDVYLTAHPERWADETMFWAGSWAFDKASNIAKRFLALRNGQTSDDVDHAERG